MLNHRNVDDFINLLCGIRKHVVNEPSIPQPCRVTTVKSAEIPHPGNRLHPALEETTEFDNPIVAIVCVCCSEFLDFCFPNKRDCS